MGRSFYIGVQKLLIYVFFFFFSKGIQSIPPQGGKLEIAGMVVGQWAGNKPVRGRGGFNMQVVSVGAGRGWVISKKYFYLISKALEMLQMLSL